MLLLLLLAMLWVLPRSSQQQLTNQEFLDALDNAAIQEVVIKQNQQAPTGEVCMQIGDRVYNAYVSDVKEAQQLLTEREIDYRMDNVPQNSYWTVSYTHLTDEEREKFSRLLEAGFIDTYRYFYPEQEGVYSWWSYRFRAREKNAGWRIDYFCVSESLKDRLLGAKIHTEVMGSDHCPVELELA